MQVVEVKKLSDEMLLKNLKTLAWAEKRIDASFVRHLVEMERRKIYLPRYRSLYLYLTLELGVAESSALKRTQVVRASLRVPESLVLLEKGEISFSSLSVLSPCLKGEQGKEVLRQAKGMSRRECELLVRQLDPKAEEQDRVKPLTVRKAVAGGANSATTSTQPKLEAERVKVEFCASNRFAKKLHRAQEVLRPSCPDGRYEAVLERALDVLLEKLDPQKKAERAYARQKKKLLPSVAKPNLKVPMPLAKRTRNIPAHVRHEVYRRDGGCCRYAHPDGRVCGSKDGVELDHVHPFACGGSHSPENLRLLCRSHNLFAARQVYGQVYMDRCQKGQSGSSVAR